ncbi:Hypothetical predicted protein [Podarcis lilfordi]|uniref:Uncharacterized protein n=1 Tax=Podarcis lilfordi TaxID=74358 RepID=A0AA35PTG6_9SAUR|nr:Hypothetical predicted protein [Podarcis lilfordi]
MVPARLPRPRQGAAKWRKVGAHDDRTLAGQLGGTPVGWLAGWLAAAVQAVQSWLRPPPGERGGGASPDSGARREVPGRVTWPGAGGGAVAGSPLRGNKRSGRSSSGIGKGPTAAEQAFNSTVGYCRTLNRLKCFGGSCGAKGASGPVASLPSLVEAVG